MKTASKTIALLAPRSSIHTTRWANGLAKKGHKVHLISIEREGPALIPTVEVHFLPHSAPWGYFFNRWALKEKLEKIRPQLLHAHFVSGYGTLATLSGFHPRMVSVWGTDIYDFPKKSPFHNWLVKRTLDNSLWVCSTSEVMAEQAQRVHPGVKNKIDVTPFGIDLSLFKKSPSESRDFIVGTVKTLSPKYGIDTLIEGFHIFLQKRDSKRGKARLIIVGDGPQKTELTLLVEKLRLGDHVEFKGAIAHEQIPQYLNQFDIYAAMSRDSSESFGVAIIEASAMSKPVVVSNVGGLPEVVDDGQTGFVVEKNSPGLLADKLLQLEADEELRARLGQQGRLMVEKKYDWNLNLEKMERIYDKVISMRTK